MYTEVRVSESRGSMAFPGWHVCLISNDPDERCPSFSTDYPEACKKRLSAFIGKTWGYYRSVVSNW